MSDAPVLAFDDRTYTRSQVDALSAGLADTLSQRGVHAGQRVALMSSNRPEFVFAVKAIWQLGASAVLISPAWKAAEVSTALAVSGAQHAVGDNPVLAELMPMLHLDEPITPGTRRPSPSRIPTPMRCWSSVRAPRACPRPSATPTGPSRRPCGTGATPWG